jgi:putative membrane protein
MNPNRAKWMVALVLSLCGSMAQAVTVNAFLEEAAQQSVFQTEGAKVALQKSQMPEVKDFANQMISKNAQLYGKLKALGEQLHMNVPDEASLAGKAKQMRLESRDESFDRIYIDSQAETLEQKSLSVQERSDVVGKTRAEKSSRKPPCQTSLSRNKR